MKKAPAFLPTFLSWLITLLVPVTLTLSAVRLMLTPLYIQWEYNLPNFPADRYGFTKQDRLYWGNITRQYLLNSDGISFLADLRFPDGQPVYNERELRHMVDVKVTLSRTLQVWITSLVLLLGLGIWAWYDAWWQDFTRGVRRGAWVTVGLLVAILVFVLFLFEPFFIAFHNVFFDPGTWMFLWSDTLIRLFPEKFWQDIFILVGGLSLGGALALIVLLRPSK